MDIVGLIDDLIKMLSIFAVPFFARVAAKQDAITEALKQESAAAQSDNMVKLSQDIDLADAALEKELAPKP